AAVGSSTWPPGSSTSLSTQFPPAMTRSSATSRPTGPPAVPRGSRCGGRSRTTSSSAWCDCWRSAELAEQLLLQGLLLVERGGRTDQDLDGALQRHHGVGCDRGGRDRTRVGLVLEAGQVGRLDALRVGLTAGGGEVGRGTVVLDAQDDRPDAR